MNSKERYRKLCEKELSIPIFSRDWWLDAVCNDAWDVCLVEKGDQILAAMPYCLTKRHGLTYLCQPSLTQTLGPWVRPNVGKYYNRLSQEKKLFTELINQLPDFALFRQNWHYSNTNWLPFYWQGFNQTTRYTYILPDLRDLDSVWAGFQANIRNKIRKAERFNLQVRTDVSIDDFLKLNDKVFDRQGLEVPYSPEFVYRLDQFCATRKARQIFISEDDQGQKHAGIYVVWDEQSAYCLMTGGDPRLRSSGATSLCIWEAIKFAATKTKSFDFEGSMIEPVEIFYRSFGAIQTPYFAVSKTHSRILRAALAARGLLRG